MHRNEIKGYVELRRADKRDVMHKEQLYVIVKRLGRVCLMYR
jgi:hypothetical protein